MKTFSIPEAIAFLADEYGQENMPTSEETLRRSIRTKRLIAQGEGIPGRKGYKISEDDLRAYAENRLRRSRSRNGRAAAYGDAAEPISFPELFSQYVDKKITPNAYYQSLFSERMKWERIMHEKQAELARKNAELVALQSEIQSCESAIEAFSDGISKYQP